MSEDGGHKLRNAVAAAWSGKKWLRVAVQILALVLLPTGGLVGLPWGLAFFVPGLVAQAGSLILNEIVKSVTSQLEEDLVTARTALGRERRSADLARTQWLAALLKRHELGNDERVTLYAYNGAERLVKIARWAIRPEWNTEGRDSYPIGEGLLSTVWRESEVYVDDVPDPASDRPGYVAFHLETRLGTAAVDDLDMPSRAYLGRRLGTPQSHVGVVMFESADPQGLAGLRDSMDLLSAELEALSAVAEYEVPLQSLDEVSLLEGLE